MKKVEWKVFGGGVEGEYFGLEIGGDDGTFLCDGGDFGDNGGVFLCGGGDFGFEYDPPLWWFLWWVFPL